MDVELKNKITLIIGLNGSGKTFFTENKIIPSHRCLVHDPLKQYDEKKCYVYYPRFTTYPQIAQDNEIFIEKIVIPQSKKYDLLIYEECNRTFPNQKEFYPKFRSFFDTYRHYNNYGLVFICRRPPQINTDITNLAHHIIIFGVKGRATINTLNNEAAGLGDAASKLSNYRYIFVNESREFKELPPI